MGAEEGVHPEGPAPLGPGDEAQEPTGGLGWAYGDRMFAQPALTPEDEDHIAGLLKGPAEEAT